MSCSSQLQDSINFQESIQSQQNHNKDAQITIIVPFRQSHKQNDSYSNISSQKLEATKMQSQINVENEQKFDKKTNQKNIFVGQNVFKVQKNYSRLSSNNSQNESELKNNIELVVTNQKADNQVNFKKNLPQKSFYRTDFKNHRRSLHVIVKENDDNINNKVLNENLIFMRKNNRVISQQNTYRRYAQGNQTNIQSQKDFETLLGQVEKQVKMRNTHMTSMNNKIFVKNNSSKRYQSQSLSKLDQQDIFNHPERNSQRVVVFLKTYIISPFQSVSIEVSLLKNSLIIVANLIGQQKQTIKMVLNQQRTQKLFKQSYNDWQILGKRVFLEMTPSGGKRIKISPIKQLVDFVKIDTKQQKFQFNKQLSTRNYMNKMREDKKRQIYLRQKQFIRRNYYSIINKVENVQNVQKTINENFSQNQNKFSNENTIYNTQKQKSSTIQTKEIYTKTNFGFKNPTKTNFSNHTKHLDYMSPQIRQKIKHFKNQKQKSLNSQNVEKEKLKRQAFLKKQHNFIERLSKSKDNKETQKENKKQNSQSKEKPFVVFKVGSVNNLAHSFLPNQRKTRILSKLKQNKKSQQNQQNQQNIETKQINVIKKSPEKQFENENEKQNLLIIQQTEKELSQKRIQSQNESQSQKNQPNDKKSSRKQLSLQNQTRQINKVDSVNHIVDKNKTINKGTEQAQQEEQYQFEQQSQDQHDKQNENQYQEDQFQSESKQQSKNNPKIKSEKSSTNEKIIDKNKESQNQYSDLIKDIDDEYENQYDDFYQEKPSKILQSQDNKEKIPIDSQYQESYQKDFQPQKYQENLQEEYAFSEQDNLDQVQQENYLEQEFIE